MAEKVIGVIGGASGGALTDHLHNRGCKVALVVGKEGESGTANADYVCIADLRDEEKITDFFQLHQVKHIIVGTGHRFAFQLAETLDKKGYMLNINIQASLIAKEKILYKDMITSKGFNTPAYAVIRDINELNKIDVIATEIGYPCVVKSSVDTMYPQKASNREELVAAAKAVLDSDSPVLVEDFVKGVDVTVPVETDKENVKALGVCYYSKAEECDLKGVDRNEFLREQLSQEEEAKVLKQCEDLVRASNFEGVPRIDAMVVPPHDVSVLEVNSVGVTEKSARYAPFSKAVLEKLEEKGIDLAKVTVDLALKKFEE